MAHTRGQAKISFGRQIAMYLCHVSYKMPMVRIAHALHRDRSTVAHACRVIEDCRDDPAWDQILDQLELVLSKLPASFTLQPFYDRSQSRKECFTPFELIPLDLPDVDDSMNTDDLFAPEPLSQRVKCANLD